MKKEKTKELEMQTLVLHVPIDGLFDAVGSKQVQKHNAFVGYTSDNDGIYAFNLLGRDTSESTDGTVVYPVLKKDFQRFSKKFMKYPFMENVVKHSSVKKPLEKALISYADFQKKERIKNDASSVDIICLMGIKMKYTERVKAINMLIILLPDPEPIRGYIVSNTNAITDRKESTIKDKLYSNPTFYSCIRMYSNIDAGLRLFYTVTMLAVCSWTNCKSLLYPIGEKELCRMDKAITTQKFSSDDVLAEWNYFINRALSGCKNLAHTISSLLMVMTDVTPAIMLDLFTTNSVSDTEKEFNISVEKKKKTMNPDECVMCGKEAFPDESKKEPEVEPVIIVDEKKIDEAIDAATPKPETI